MKFKWLVHGKYEGFVSKHEPKGETGFTSNIPTARMFETQDEARWFARKLIDDNKIQIADILAYPSEGNEVK